MKQSYTPNYLMLFLLSIFLVIQGCDPDLVPEINPTQGNLDLFRYISIGDSYSAGVSNADFNSPLIKGLYEESQRYSFPNILSEQFQIIEPTRFEQPILSGNGSGYLALSSFTSPECGLSIPKAEITKIPPEINWFSPYISVGNINNYAVPNLTSEDLFSDSLYYTNSFFNRMSPDVQANYADILLASNPTFFTLWLGQEDIIPYALYGAADQTIKPTSSRDFSEQIFSLLYSLKEKSAGTKGVIGNIPDITDYPYFTALEHEYIATNDCNESPRSIYIETSFGTPRKASRLDLILLPTASLIGKNYLGLTPEKPIPNHLVLDAFEVAEVRNTISLYNSQLDSVVNALNAQTGGSRYQIVDMYGLFKELSLGHTIDGLEISNQYLSGGIFSIDGIYLTPRGNAVIANEFIQAINQNSSFSAIIPTINITDYPGVVFP